MQNKFLSIMMAGLLSLIAVSNVGASSSGPATPGKKAIVLASFGTTVPEAVKAITNIYHTVQEAFPQTEVRISFTSNIIRSVWKKRRAEADKWLAMGIPANILYGKNIISTIGDLREDGYSDIIVQPTHMFYMEQSQDLSSYVEALASIKTTKKRWQPFNSLNMGRPALGMPGDRYDYHADIRAAVATLADDARMAEEQGAMLVYMGHGNEYWSTGIYQETEKAMRKAYPGVKTYIGVVEGHPGIDDLLPRLAHGKTDKIILKPFMIVAGDHATNDMAGPEADSWKSILSREGYEVTAILQGLGENNGFAALFADHIKDAAQEHGLRLQ